MMHSEVHSALFVVALYIVILVGCDFGILAAILTIVAFYGLFELLTRESPGQKDERFAEKKKIFENGGTNRHLSTNVIKLKMKRAP